MAIINATGPRIKQVKKYCYSMTLLFGVFNIHFAVYQARTIAC